MLRGYPQALGLNAPDDFYAGATLLSTQEPKARLKGVSWDERLRLPVDAGTLSHAIAGNVYETRLTADAAERVLSSDRVFWQLGSAAKENEPAFVKIMDGQENFIYEYYIDPLGKESFSLYTVGAADQPYSVSVEGDKCSARIVQDRTLSVTCPKGQSCIVTVTSGDGKYWDTVLISNAGRFRRETALTIERELRVFWDEILPQSNSVRLFQAGMDWTKSLLRGSQT